MIPQPETSRAKRIGGAMVLGAVFVAFAVTLYPERLNAPAWIAYVAAAVFAIGGATALARAYGRQSLANVLVCLVLAGMLVIGSWIALGPGARACVGGVAGTGVPVSELACRSAFGVGALVVAGMLVLAVRGLRRRPVPK